VTDFIFWQFEALWRKYDAAVVKSSDDSGNCKLSSENSSKSYSDRDGISKGKSNGDSSSSSSSSSSTSFSTSNSTSNSNRTIKGSNTNTNTSTIIREGLSSDVIEVSYKALTSDPLRTLRAVYAHVQAPLSATQTALLQRETDELRASYKKNRLGALSPQMRAKIRERFKGYFEAFHYK
jgi:hypothetical protein